MVVYLLKVIEACGVELVKPNVILVSLYRSGLESFEIFLRNLDCLLHFISKRGKTIILVGDFNIDFLKRAYFQHPN